MSMVYVCAARSRRAAGRAARRRARARARAGARTGQSCTCARPPATCPGSCACRTGWVCAGVCACACVCGGVTQRVSVVCRSARRSCRSGRCRTCWRCWRRRSRTCPVLATWWVLVLYKLLSFEFDYRDTLYPSAHKCRKKNIGEFVNVLIFAKIIKTKQNIRGSIESMRK